MLATQRFSYQLVVFYRAKQDRFYQGPAVSLYLDDIEEVVAIISEACEHVMISDGEYNFDSIGELIEKRGTRPQVLRLSGKRLGVSLEIKCRTAKGVVLASNDDVESEIAFFRLQEILHRRRRLFGGIPVALAGFVLACVPFAFLVPHINLRQPPDSVPRVLVSPTYFLSFVTLFLLGLGLYGFGMNLSGGFWSSINLARKHEATTFWSRNRENLTVGAIGVVVGALLIKFIELILSAF